MPETTATTTPHGEQTYAPESGRSGRALCLSGGGFRASLFHLGALRRLNELGLLGTFDTISAVSGGSIIAAFVASRVRPWPDAQSPRVEDWERQVAEPFRRFARRNIRTWPLLRRFLWPLNWTRSGVSVESLQDAYARHLSPLHLGELPERPAFVFNATEMAYGVNWEARRDSVGDYRLGYLSPAPPSWTVARAVAASSCFPPVFGPMAVDDDLGGFKGGRADDSSCAAEIDDVRLTDGGNYDNLGLEPVWKDHQLLLVSDGGSTFDAGSDQGLLSRVSRYSAIQGQQVTSIRKRWLISNFISGTMRGAYWGIGSHVESYRDADALTATIPAYSRDAVDCSISEVRTDMDAFSDDEARVLENHGYLVSAAALARHLPDVAEPDSPGIAVPHPQWMDDARVRDEWLKDSSKRRLPLGRGWRPWRPRG